MKDMGAAGVMVGIKITRDKANAKLFVSHLEYANTLFERFGMSESKPVGTPMDKTYFNLSHITTDPTNTSKYRQAIRSLMYLMIGFRPDLVFSIVKLSQHCQNPSKNHWTAVKSLLRQVSGTHDFGILFDGTQSTEIPGFSEADWAGCKTTRNSTSGADFLIAGGAVSWRSKKQTCVATSKCEAEYIASSDATKEAIWLSRLVADLTLPTQLRIVDICEDNDGAIASAENASVNTRNKHVDIKYHFV